MIEVDFKDRVPTHAGRIKLTPVDGQPDIFTMARADEPAEEGTPLDKATFDSITQSRLTGRFYSLIALEETITTVEGVVSPIPTTNWSVGNDNIEATSGSFKISASSAIDSTYAVAKAVDAETETAWASVYGTQHIFTIELPSSITVKSVRLNLGSAGNTTGFNMSVQGSLTGDSWSNLYTITSFPSGATEYTLTTNGDYKYYRFVCNFDNESRIYIYELAFTSWAVNTYTIDFQTDKTPLTWDDGQRVTIKTPTFGALAVASNTFNGVKVNTILQPSKRYVLTYNGTTFDAKEV